jgi:hypothetical protein
MRLQERRLQGIMVAGGCSGRMVDSCRTMVEVVVVVVVCLRSGPTAANKASELAAAMAWRSRNEIRTPGLASQQRRQ